jgi:hypothetical protein
MIGLFDRGCARYFPVLVEFVDGGRPGPETDSALAHLDRCPHCLDELEATALAVHGLRLLARNLHDVEPPPDAWARLRTRIEARAPSRFLLAARLSSAALTVGIVAALALPWAVARGDASGTGGGVRSDAPGQAFDATPVILAERAFERPSARPGAFVVITYAAPAAAVSRLSDEAPPGRLDGWVPEPIAPTEDAAQAAPPSRRSTTR